MVKMINKFRKRLLVTALAASMVITPVMSLQAAPNIDNIKKNKAAAEKEAADLKTQINDIAGKLVTLESELVDTGEKIIKAEGDLKAAKKKEAKQYDDMKLRIQYMYEAGDSSVLTSLLESKSLSEFVNRAQYAQDVHTYDRKQLEEYVATKNKIAKLKDELVAQQAKLEKSQTDFEKQQDRLNKLYDAKNVEIKDLNKELQEAIRKAAEEEERRRKAAAEAKRREEARKAAEREAARRAEAAARRHQNNNSGSQTSNAAGNTERNTNNNTNGNTNNANSGAGQVTPARPEPKPVPTLGNTGTASAIVSAAYSQMGVPYVWGGTSPGSGLDCSGLVQYCHRVAGINIGRTSWAQGGGGRPVSDPQPGDIVYYGGHVGIYIGGGNMIHAPQPGECVKISNVNYRAHSFVRYW